MTTADQINDNSSPEILAAFLKFAPEEQFRLLSMEKVETLDYGLEDAYEKINDVVN